MYIYLIPDTKYQEQNIGRKTLKIRFECRQVLNI